MSKPRAGATEWIDRVAFEQRVSLGLLASLYLASGALGLIYEVAFSKYLGLSFGATAAASSAVLVAFMGGLALGAHLTGRFERHVRRPLFWYGSVELSIGLFCLLVPTLFARLTPFYVLLAAHTHSLVVLSVVRGLLAMSIVAVPAVGMGSTLPLLARFIHGASPGEDAAANRKLATLYGINTLGGALGSLGSAYLILPYLGLSLTLRSCAGASISIGLLALLLARRQQTMGAVPGAPKEISPQPADGFAGASDSTSASAAPSSSASAAPSSSASAAPSSSASAAPSSSASVSEAVASSLATSLQALSSEALSSPGVAGARLTPNQAYALAALSGLLVFSCEVIATHLLALVIGTSVYAFGLMLAIFLICLSLGTPLARWFERRLGGSALSISLALTGLALIGSLPIWDQLPRLFVALGPSVRSWHARELVRGLAAFVALAVPVTLMGTTFPLVLRAARGAHVLKDIGRITSFNTLGSIAGSLLAGFVILERLGSYRSLICVAMGYLAGAVLGERRKASRLLPGDALAGAGVLLALLVPPWDLQRLTNGANVYFDAGVVENGILESIAEDVHGGVTTVVRDPKTNERTLLTNGKFQGNDSQEVTQNKGFAYLPSLFARRTDGALVIGMGTAVTAGALAEFPYRQIDIAELAPAIMKAARTTFGAVNGHVLDDPRTHVLTEDGRNALLVNDTQYDVITVEVTSIWFAGAGNLYNREFYETARSRLAKGGVLQQWLAFHHTNRQVVATILATIRSSFPYVALFVDGHQGHILASVDPLKAKLARVDEFASTRGLDPDELLTFVRGAVLDSDAIDDFVRDTAQMQDIGIRHFLSTDDNLVLEYETPKGNVPTADGIPTTLGYLYEYKPAGIVRAHVQM